MTFRLASLLKVRRLQADTAAARAGAATAAAQAAHRHAETRHAALAESGHVGHTDAWTFQAGVAARATRASMYTESVADAAQADDEALEQRGQWAQARRAVRALERLEVRHLEEQNAAALAAEQVVLDEHGTRSRAAAVRDARRAADTADTAGAARTTGPVGTGGTR